MQAHTVLAAPLALIVCVPFGIGPPVSSAQTPTGITRRAEPPRGHLRILVKGKRYGQSARVSIDGITGRADGWTRTVRVKKNRTLTGLRPGTYVVRGRRILSRGRRVVAAPVTVRLTARAGAIARLRYRRPDPAPGAVTGLRMIARTTTSVTIGWNLPPDTDVAAVDVRRVDVAGEHPQVMNLPAGSSSLVDQGLTAATGFTYFVTVRDRGGKGSDTAVLNARTLGDIDAGFAHTCALSQGGVVKCWGSNASGQIGDGTTGGHRLKPARAGEVAPAIAVTAGAEHSCAVTDGGAVFCWGDNSRGQLGDGTMNDRDLPARVPGLGPAVAIDAGDHHTCALLRGGDVACWGANDRGQIGDGTLSDRPSPKVVASAASSVATGALHTCAATSAGAVRCWGSNASGEIGDGTTSLRPSPTDVAGITSATSVGAGTGHSCAALRDGTARCWGYNLFGEVGDGTTVDRHLPAVVGGLSQVAVLEAGDLHTCAQLANGDMRCWGANAFGQLGDTTTVGRPTPVAVVGLAGVTQITAGGSHSCALVADGGALCWGFNGDGQLGNGTASGTLPNPAPVAVVGL
jgi:alpha-tubulin suppressor-like RCC1 family protein